MAYAITASWYDIEGVEGVFFGPIVGMQLVFVGGHVHFEIMFVDFVGHQLLARIYAGVLDQVFNGQLVDELFLLQILMPQFGIDFAKVAAMSTYSWVRCTGWLVSLFQLA